MNFWLKYFVGACDNLINDVCWFGGTNFLFVKFKKLERGNTKFLILRVLYSMNFEEYVISTGFWPKYFIRVRDDLMYDVYFFGVANVCIFKFKRDAKWEIRNFLF